MPKYISNQLSNILKIDSKKIKKHTNLKNTEILNKLSSFFGYRHYHELKQNEKNILQLLKYNNYIYLNNLSYSEFIILKGNYQEYIKLNLNIDFFYSSLDKAHEIKPQFKINESNEVLDKIKNKIKFSNITKEQLKDKYFLFDNIFKNSFQEYSNLSKNKTIYSNCYTTYSWEGIYSDFKTENIISDMYKIESYLCGFGKNKIIFFNNLNYIKNLETVFDLFFDENNKLYDSEGIIDFNYLNKNNEYKAGVLFSLNTYMYFECLDIALKKLYSITKNDYLKISNYGYDFECSFKDNCLRFIIFERNSGAFSLALAAS